MARMQGVHVDRWSYSGRSRTSAPDSIALATWKSGRMPIPASAISIVRTTSGSGATVCVSISSPVAMGYATIAFPPPITAVSPTPTL